uniref:Uncharacterized protein n=1 Tax=Picea sitchensis TaxID=3332 RepID=D5AAH2_PICSI|nr:unknown [Picea sitchensis]
MPEELHVSGLRETLHLNPSDDGSSNVDSDQQTQQHINTGTTTYHRFETHQHATNPRNTEMRTPEALARALLRARESIQNKENLVPEKPGSQRRGRRRRLVVSTSRSPLPSDYPRAPLQDITAYMHALQRSRSRTRTRMQLHGITPPRQPITHDSPVQERSAQEGPLQVEQTTTTIIPSPVPEQEIEGAVTREETDVHNLGPERPLMYQTRVDMDNSSTVDTRPGLQQDNQVQEISPRDDSRLTERTFGRAFGTVLQSGPQNEISGRDRNGSCPQPKKTSSSKNTAKTLMKMR